MADNEITITGDSASPAVRRLLSIFKEGSPALRIGIMQDLGDSVVGLTKRHVLNNGTNKQNWPTTGFYKAVAQNGIDYELLSDEALVIHIDHPEKSGAMKQRYYGGRIEAKDKLLTIPAREEFYGHGAREFTNLRYGQFGRGPDATKFLYIGQGGTSRLAGTKEQRVRGAGARTFMMIAYWLKDSVFQEGDPGVIPSEQDYIDNVQHRLGQHVRDMLLNTQ